MDATVFVVLIIIGGLSLIWWVHRANNKREEEVRRLRRQGLIKKYGSELIADDIMAHKIWQGMTIEQLVDSWGQPSDVDQKVFKQKISETWKYGQTGKKTF